MSKNQNTSDWFKLVWEDDTEMSSIDALDGLMLDPDGDIVSVSYYSKSREDNVVLPEWIQVLKESNSIVMINGGIYVYLEEAHGWMPLLSAKVMQFIVTQSGGYAPVNYAMAALPYIETITRSTWPSVVLGNTFTQGYKRYNFRYISDSAVEFIPVTNKDSMKDNYCTIPTQNIRPIHKMSLIYRERLSSVGAVKWISDVFDTNDVLTILWMLGDMHADFGTKRMFILYGPGGVGKSSVVNIIAAAIGGTLCKLNDSAILYNPDAYYGGKGLDAATLLQASGSRMATTADIEMPEGRAINMQTIKALTGNDMAEGGMRVNVTVVSTMNRLYIPKRMQDQARADITRRVVVVPTKLTRKSQDVDTLPIDQKSIEELILLSIRTRVLYDSPPLGTKALLHTLYHGRYAQISLTVEEYQNATVWDCLAATMFILWTLRITHEELQHILMKIGSQCCIRWGSILLIRNIRLIPGARVHECWYNKPPTPAYKAAPRGQSKRYPRQVNIVRSLN